MAVELGVPRGVSLVLGDWRCSKSWIRDQEFEKALAWISEQVAALSEDLQKLGPKLKTEILARRTKRTYRAEVTKRIQGLWFQESPKGEASDLGLPLTPEERAEAIRARLNM